MEISYNYQLNDFEELSEAIERKYPRPRRIRIALGVVGAAIIFAPFLASGSLFRPEQFLFGLALLGPMFLYFAFQTPRRTARKVFNKNAHKKDYKATIEEAGIVILSPTVRTELQWKAFSESVQSDKVIGLFYESVVYVFPRRAFTPEQWNEVLELIRQHVP